MASLSVFDIDVEKWQCGVTQMIMGLVREKESFWEF